MLFPSFHFSRNQTLGSVGISKAIGVDEEIVSLLADDVRIGVLEGIGNRLVDNEEISGLTRENMMEFMEGNGQGPFGVLWGVRSRSGTKHRC